DCSPGELLGVEANGSYLVLANVDGDLYALEDRCSHQDYPLSDGELQDGTLECMYHGACFDVTSGKATQLPAIKPVKAYNVDVRDSEIFVEVE
ncbi:MAG: Rieske 2Fe-2S domain-containing protein, partial [Gemmatimonadetes bacterium]|nr:Rieske 2Fe-2S domain-containing protein [Gemmatimonadota bacterium]NIR77330.1 Rieske 2Fe-2S domain-containing protein [Gemmatimonadota bacterium]NIT85856.1 Rieske 2Fe-2S domain-containing protein [Gemmatimonadota bacterium]NIU29678.1 Rieske 2Fe-2S domain-containing protein [Gemmatimonadota bacterium]NIU34722.1 Rieske 2Fe-2S domain-containing protein [Gemmatimonadota bacterium]